MLSMPATFYEKFHLQSRNVERKNEARRLIRFGKIGPCCWRADLHQIVMRRAPLNPAVSAIQSVSTAQQETVSCRKALGTSAKNGRAHPCRSDHVVRSDTAAGLPDSGGGASQTSPGALEVRLSPTRPGRSRFQSYQLGGRSRAGITTGFTTGITGVTVIGSDDSSWSAGGV